jgi:2-isopropylmalate synthase
MVSNYTGLAVQVNKAVVGKNAFAHEAGIHQDGMLKHASTYEIMKPEDVGLDRSKLVLGKHSGRHALKARLQELGFAIEGDLLNKVFERFKVLADAKKNITDADLVALMSDEGAKPVEYFKLVDMQVVCGTMGMPTATMKMLDQDGHEIIHAAVGVGPVDACYRAVDGVVKAPCVLTEYAVHAVTEGIDALGEVTVSIQAPDSDRTFSGSGADPDIVVSSVRAYLAALNRMIAAMGHGDVQPEGEAAAVGLGD